MTTKREPPDLWVSLHDGAPIYTYGNEVHASREKSKDGILYEERYVPASRIEELRAWVKRCVEGIAESEAPMPAEMHMLKAFALVVAELDRLLAPRDG